MVKIELCPACFERVRRARDKHRIVGILSTCPTCSKQVQAVQIASKISRQRRLTYGDVINVLRRGFP